MTNNQTSIKYDVIDLGLVRSVKQVGLKKWAITALYCGTAVGLSVRSARYVARMIFADIFRSTLLLLLLLLLKTSIAGAAVARGSSAACAPGCCRDASDV